MFESIYNPSTVPTERLLAHLIDPTRAAAIMGDLTELSATRGYLWFWVAYARTLIALSWRRAVAFVGGVATLYAMLWLVIFHSHAVIFQLGPGISLTAFIALVVGGTAAQLWFALPFIFIRFGRNNHLTKLACALFLSTLPVFSAYVPLLEASGFATVAIVAAALCFKQWRRAGTVLAITIGAGTCALVLFFKTLDETYHLAGQIYPHENNSTIRLVFDQLTVALAMLVTATVCARMHKLLLDNPHTPDHTLA